jgi:hypothetical protein
MKHQDKSINLKSTEKELRELYKRFGLKQWIPKLSKEEILIDLYNYICGDKSMLEELVEHLETIQSKLNKEYPNIWVGEL